MLRKCGMAPDHIMLRKSKGFCCVSHKSKVMAEITLSSIFTKAKSYKEGVEEK